MKKKEDGVSRTKCVCGGKQGIKNCQQAYAELISIEMYAVQRQSMMDPVWFSFFQEFTNVNLPHFIVII